MSLSIVEIKIALYHLLLQQNYKNLTERQVNIMFELSHDKDIQDWLESRKKLEMETNKVFIEGDHPVFRRISEHCSKDKALDMIVEMKRLNYENIKIDGKEIEI